MGETLHPWVQRVEMVRRCRFGDVVRVYRLGTRWAWTAYGPEGRHGPQGTGEADTMQEAQAQADEAARRLGWEEVVPTFEPGERVACRVLPDGPVVLGPYTVVGLAEGHTAVYRLRDDYETEASSTAPAELLTRLTPEQDTNWRVLEARMRVEHAIRLGHPWPVPAGVSRG